MIFFKKTYLKLITLLLSATTATTATFGINTLSIHARSNSLKTSKQNKEQLKTSPFNPAIENIKLFNDLQIRPFNYSTILEFTTIDAPYVSNFTFKVADSNGAPFDKISGYYDWSEFTAQNKKGILKWQLEADCSISENIKITVIYKDLLDGNKIKTLYESQYFFVNYSKPQFDQFSEITNKKCVDGLIKNVVSYTKNDNVPKENYIFKFLGNCDSIYFSNDWNVLVDWEKNVATISLQFKKWDSHFSYGNILGKIVSYEGSKKINETKLEIFNVEDKKCTIEVKNTSCYLNETIECAALVSVSNSAINDSLTSKLLDINNNEIKGWNAKITSGQHECVVTVVPPVLDKISFITAKIVIFSENKKIIESPITDFKTTDKIDEQTKDLHTLKNMCSLNLYDNVFYIDFSINSIIKETINIGNLSTNTLFDDSNISIVAEGNNWLDYSHSSIPISKQKHERYVDVKIVKNKDHNYEVSLLITEKFINEYLKNNYDDFKELNLFFFVNDDLKPSRSILLKKNVDHGKTQSIKTYTCHNDLETFTVANKIKFEKAFEVYFGNWYRPSIMSDFDYKIMDKNNRAIEAEIILSEIKKTNWGLPNSSTKITDVVIGCEVSIVLNNKIDPQNLKLQLIKKDLKDTVDSKLTFFSPLNKNLYFNTYELSSITKTNEFFSFEIPDVSLDWNDVTVKVKDNLDSEIKDFKISLDNSGEYTFASIQLADSTKNIIRHYSFSIEIYVDGVLTIKSKNVTINVYDILGIFENWNGDKFGFSNGNLDGYIKLSILNCEISKLKFDIVNKYGDSVISKGWNYLVEPIDNHTVKIKISSPLQMVDPTVQEIKIIAIAFSKIVGESNVLDFKIIDPILSLNQNWTYDWSNNKKFKCNISTRTTQKITLYDTFNLIKDPRIDINMLDLAKDISLDFGNEKIKISLNVQNSTKDILSYDMSFDINDFDVIEKLEKEEHHDIETTKYYTLSFTFFCNPYVSFKNVPIYEIPGKKMEFSYEYVYSLTHYSEYILEKYNIPKIKHLNYM